MIFTKFLSKPKVISCAYNISGMKSSMIVISVFFTILSVFSLRHAFSHTSNTVPINHPLKFYNGCSLKRLVEDEDEKKARYFWQSLLRPMLIPRVPGTEGHRLVHDHIIEHLSRYNIWSVSEDTFTDNTTIGVKQFSNIIATQVPEAAKKLTFVCHYESKLMRNFIGATDSAVPCAILLDIASNLDHWLRLGNGKLADQYSLRLVFLDGEEAFVKWTATDSLYGSRHLADKWSIEPDSVDQTKSKLQTIAAFVLLDLIGEAPMHFSNFFPSTTLLFESLKKIENKLHQEKLMISGRRMFSSAQLVGSGGLIIEDDHKPFLEKGVPILHIIPYPFPTAWHTARDNEDNLSWRDIDNITRIIRVFIAQFLHLQVKGCDRSSLR